MLPPLAGFQVTINGRFWVTAEGPVGVDRFGTPEGSGGGGKQSLHALRTYMLPGSTSSVGLNVDYTVILLSTTVLVWIGARSYPRLAT